MVVWGCFGADFCALVMYCGNANNKPYTAKITTESLKRHNISVDRHLPHPGLNPIGHVWKPYLHAKYPDLANTAGGPDVVCARFAETIGSNSRVCFLVIVEVYS